MSCRCEVSGDRTSDRDLLPLSHFACARRHSPLVYYIAARLLYRQTQKHSFDLEMAFSFFPRTTACLRCQTNQFLPFRAFTSTAIQSVKQLPPRRQIDEADITEVFLCGSGPGGQKIVRNSGALSTHYC